ncbi:ParA family protein [Labrys monachus]|uniref:Chromosome partitioning protein n=1 Tax=Labrys monachus TaxID=217067 RepID=A0ABU0F724_9HYPH|nr:ParA family protein [Labrys monachus]MDQ0390413.1 chromosome partitioning protein [Labrys monachus]
MATSTTIVVTSAGRSRAGRASVFAVANKKGGTGKSTTVVNLAAELSVRGFRVLVVDLDAQGHAGLGLGRVAATGAPSVHDVLCHRSSKLVDAIVETLDPLIDLAPADRNFNGDVRISDPRRLAEALAPIVYDYDAILIDTPPSSPRLIVAGMMAADAVVVPTLLDHLSFDGVGQFLRAYHGVIAELKVGCAGAMIVPSRVDLRSSMQKDVLSRMTSSYGRAQLATGVRIDVAVAEAFGACRPLRLWRPSARAVSDFARLADEILWHFVPHGLQPAPAGQYA